MEALAPDQEVMPLNSWQDALLAVRLIAVLRQQGQSVAAVVKAVAGPVRDAFCKQLALACKAPWYRLPMGANIEALTGAMDLAATLETGKPVLQEGLLVRSGNGLLAVAGAERLDDALVSPLALAMEEGRVRIEREGTSADVACDATIILFDEGENEGQDAIAPALMDRALFHLDLSTLRFADTQKSAALTEEDQVYSLPTVDDEALEASCALALGFGLTSMRPPLQVLHAASAHSALQGRASIEKSDLEVALRLCLLNRATAMPSQNTDETDKDTSPEQEPPCEDPPSDQDVEDTQSNAPDLEMPSGDMILDALAASLPDDLLTQLAAKAQKRTAEQGRQGNKRHSARRGRPLASRAGRLERGQRLDLVATLRRAAPWQKFRRTTAKEGAHGLHIRAQDFMLRRYQEKGASSVIFAVDASGSTALNRLAETKGAIQLLLAQSYARRDHVSLIAFRGEAAELVLPPTRALVRAKRALAGLPGGGGTPLASGLALGLQVARDEQNKGREPTLIVMTDGSANIDMVGEQGRATAMADALAVANSIRTCGVSVLLMDIGRFSNPRARELSQTMGAHYVPMPFANAQTLSEAVQAAPSSGLIVPAKAS